MPSFDEVRALLDARLKSAKHLTKRTMLTGKRISSTTVILRDGSMDANRTYVRSDDDSRDAVIVYGWANQANVWVTVDEDQFGQLCIVGPANGIAQQTSGEALGSSLLPPILGNVAAMDTRGYNIAPGRVRPSLAGGLVVTVDKFAFPTANARAGRDTEDFTMTVPGTASKIAWCAVVLDPRTNTLSQVTGTLYDDLNNLTEAQAYTDLVIPAGRIALGAVALKNSDTAVSVDKIIDLRRWADVDMPYNNYAATSAPGVGDDVADGYAVGSIWYDTTADRAYVCLDASAGAAVWQIVMYDPLRFKTATTLTISSGAVTVTQGIHLIDTEGAAASDDLTTINGGAAGQLLLIRAANDARDVVLKHGTGNIQLFGSADVTLNEDHMVVMLVYDGSLSVWCQVGGAGTGGSGSSPTKSINTETLIWDKTNSTAAEFDTNLADDAGRIGISGYTDLRAVLELRAAAAVNSVSVINTINGDTTEADYQVAYQYGGSSAAAATRLDNRRLLETVAASGTANVFSLAEIMYPDYANTTKFKRAIAHLAHAYDTTLFNDLSGSFLWESTAAITRLQWSANNATTTFAAGSRVRIYGVKVDTIGGGGAVNPGLTDGRLTLTTATPITTSDVTGASTLYFTPYLGNRIALYNGTAWEDISFSEVSIKLTDTQTGTLNATTTVTGLTDTSQLIAGMQVTGTNIPADTTISTVDSATQITLSAAATGSGATSLTFKLRQHQAFDVWGYLNSGALKLEFLQWTAGSTGAITGVTNVNPPVVTSNAHGLVVDDVVTIANVVGATGVNGTFRISAVTANTFTLATLANANPGAPGAYTSGGRWFKKNYVGSRATALVKQDGVNVKTGAVTRKLLGTIRVGATAGQTEEQELIRYVSNEYNEVERRTRNGIASTHTYTTATYRAWNNDLAMSVEMVCCNPKFYQLYASARIGMNTAATAFIIGLGLDSITSASGDFDAVANSSAADITVPEAGVNGGYYAAGFHIQTLLEYGASGHTVYTGRIAGWVKG